MAGPAGRGRHALPAALAVLVLAALGATGVAGCAPGASPAASIDEAGVPGTLRALARTRVTLDGRPLHVAVADTPEARRRGLMGVADLGPLDGLLFAYEPPVEAAFHMRGVPVPLDIAFVDADGSVLDVLTMPVCEAEPCPTYRTPGAIRWALETEAGGLAGVRRGDELRP